MRKILITGGAGFIGSHITEDICQSYPEARVIVLDRMTYAADVSYVMPLIEGRRVQLAVGDICDYEFCARQIDGCDLVIHAAAESHVDRSFHSSLLFSQTNALGTHTVMEACRVANVSRIIHVSTDEVYGEVLSGATDEGGALNPTNPYSASKAAAEMVVNGYRHSFKLPVVVIRANNVYGIRQFPEKLIPRCIMALITNQKIPLHGDGSNVRHYLAAEDLASALTLLVERGAVHETYNIGSIDEFSNRQVASMICKAFEVEFDRNVEFVSDRPFNDRRYAISWNKIADLGWKPKRSLPAEIPSMVDWYKANKANLLERLRWIV